MVSMAIVGQAQSRYCYQDAMIQTSDGKTELNFTIQELGEEPLVLRFSTSPLVTAYFYLVTDRNNNIIDVLRSNLIDVNKYGEGKYRIWSVSYIGRILAQPGTNAANTELASFCYALSKNFVTLNIVDPTKLRLQILHNNDGESKLLPGADGYGGVAQFKALIDQQRTFANDNDYESVLLSSGDNFLPGKEFDANLSLPAGAPLYDTRALEAFGYDALCLGNHDFDFGPQVLGRFISGFDQSVETPKFLSANLDFSAEPSLAPLFDAGRIAASSIVERNGQKIGIVGLTTPNLPFISSPGDVMVFPEADLKDIAQAEVDALMEKGINKIILISHLQGKDEDLELIKKITDVDIVIAGGGDELLINNPENIIPGDEEEVKGTYPLVALDAEQDTVYVVTTSGQYRYLGNLLVTFNGDGLVTEIGVDSDALPVKGEVDATVKAEVEDPVQEHVDNLEKDILGVTEVDLDGRRSSVRGIESNEGNLIADALLWQANISAEAEGSPTADVAIANGGGIRNNNIVPAGTEISRATTFDFLPFGNQVTILDEISAAQFKLVLENAVSRITPDGPVGEGTGRFAQVAGFTFEYALEGTPLAFNDETGELETEGNRIVTVTLTNGTVLVENGKVVEDAPGVRVATGDFLARGGDQYPYDNVPFTIYTVTGQQALEGYIRDRINGVITAEDYPFGGSGRITQVDLPEMTEEEEEEPTEEPEEVDFSTVAEAIKRNNLLQILERGIENAGLDVTLEAEEGPFTVFAPINNAFAALDHQELVALFDDPDGALKNTLLNHVVAQRILSTDLSDGQTVTTLLGNEVTVSIVGDEVFIGGAKVVDADITAGNGVIHLIEMVVR